MENLNQLTSDNMREFDLSFWENAEIFTAVEVVSLAVGYHPEMESGWLGYDSECRRKHIMHLMQEAHDAAEAWSAAVIKRAAVLGFTEILGQRFGKLHNPPIDGKLPQEFHLWAKQLDAKCGQSGVLFSILLQDEFEHASPAAFGTKRNRRLNLLMSAVGIGKPREMFQFRRDHVVDWLNHIGWRSEYFGTPSKARQAERLPSQDRVSADSVLNWPWGQHETELLRVMKKAALKWWVNYDPSDPTTAPTNDDVANWIVEHKLASKYMAQSIATILRAEGLPSGPRKS